MDSICVNGQYSVLLGTEFATEEDINSKVVNMALSQSPLKRLLSTQHPHTCSHVCNGYLAKSRQGRVGRVTD